MSPRDELRSYDAQALNNNQRISSVVGKQKKASKISKKLKPFRVVSLLIAMIVVVGAFFSLGNIQPMTFLERIIEMGDVQRADELLSKAIIFKDSLAKGELPENTLNILRSHGVEITNDGTTLIFKNKVITADNLISEVQDNFYFYEVFRDATYLGAAYWHDDAARTYLNRLGTTLDNYSETSDFDVVMSTLVGEGSDININTVSRVQRTRKNSETGEEETYTDYEENGPPAHSSEQALTLIDNVRKKNWAETATESALNTADALKVADTISKEQRSSLFFLTFMENISKTMAGKGNAAKLPEAMNFLYEKAESERQSVRTAQMVKTIGTPLEDPSLYAVLTGTKISASEVEDYSSDRTLKMIENQINAVGGAQTISETVASASNKKKGSIGRFIKVGLELASKELMEIVAPTISSSLIDNSYNTYRGTNAGQFLVEGAINTFAGIAQIGGATMGDENTITQYRQLNNKVLAMEVKIDRMNRSPFDITSKNTFLGSIVYNFALVSMKYGSSLSGIKQISTLVGMATSALLPKSYADGTEGYLSVYGDCETYANIGAVGTAQCARNMGFDITTYDDPLNDPGFIDFVEENTYLSSSGVRLVKDGGALANFIKYHVGREETPIGVIDGGILDSLINGSIKIPFLTSILEMIKLFLKASEEDKRIASGAAFVNSGANHNWQTYKYAQRYVSLARATTSLRRFAGENAYKDVKFFEGSENPVIVFLNNYYLATR